MKKRYVPVITLAVILTGLSAAFSVSAFAAETYKLDPAHTSVVFRVKHLGVSYVYGRFNGPAVGLHPDLEFKPGIFHLEPEDTLLVYIDIFLHLTPI